MPNIKRDYIIVQLVNLVFFILAYMFVRDYFGIDKDADLVRFIITLILFVSAVYVFHTNRIFFIIARNKTN